MEGAPPTYNTLGLIADMKSVSDGITIHDFHIWQLSVGKYAISAHVNSSDPIKTLKLLTELCKSEKYGIDHITLQVENSNEIEN